MSKKVEGIVPGTKRIKPKRVVRILSVNVSVGSLVKADEERVRQSVPSNWALHQRIRLPYVRRILLKYTVAITD